VLVSPTALRRQEVDDISHFLRVSRLPLLGLITYPPRNPTGITGPLARKRP
jgi:hypothetical protein